MNFWQFANESPFLVGICVLVVSLSLVDISGNIARAFRRRGSKEGK